MSHPSARRVTIAQLSLWTESHQPVLSVGHPIPIDHPGSSTTHHAPLQTPLLFPVQILLYPYTVDAPIEPAWILYQFDGTGEPAAWIFPLTCSVVVGAAVPIPTFPAMMAHPAGELAQPYHTVSPALLPRKLLVQKLFAL